jgi:hypothetical protein
LSLTQAAAQNKKLMAKMKSAEVPENMFDLSQSQLCAKMSQMQALISGNVPELTQEEQDRLHTKPIAEMGNYQTRMKQHAPLRDPLESEADSKQKEKNMFGNPYKKPTKKLETAIDEFEDEASTLGVSSTSKRKRHSFYNFRRTLPKLFSGAIYVPPISLKWPVDEMYNAAKAKPVIDYDPVVNLSNFIRENTVAAPSLLSQSPLTTSDFTISSGDEYSDAESKICSVNGDTQMEVPSEASVSDASGESWPDARRRLHRAIYEWPGKFDKGKIKSKNEKERKYVEMQLKLVRRT